MGVFIDQHGERYTDGTLEACESDNEGFFDSHAVAEVLDPFNEASDWEEPGDNAYDINHDCNPYFLTEDDVLKVKNLDTDAATCD